MGISEGKRKPAIPSSEDLCELALDGLFARFGCAAEWTDYRTGPGSDPSPTICQTCSELLQASNAIGKAIRTEPGPNNQFALYSLAFPHILPNLLLSAGDIGSGPKLEASRDRPVGIRGAGSLNRVTTAVSEFRREVALLAAEVASEDDEHQEDEAEDISSTLRKYVTRDNIRMNKTGHYGMLLFFLVGLAARTNYQFASDEVLAGSPAVRNVFLESQAAAAADDATPALVAEKALESLGRGRISLQSRIALGGLLEAGATDIRQLWRPLFNENPKEHIHLSSRVSAQNHYIAYRLTSSEDDVEVLKSFLVFQAPGYLPDHAKTRREHFAWKAFTKYDTELMQSVGAVVGLGNQIVGFASRRTKRIGEDGPQLLRPSDFRGATMLIFNQDWFTSSLPASLGFMVGMLMTTNQQERNAACPILCLSTDLTHSDDAGLGVISRERLVEDMIEYTRLSAAPDADYGSFLNYLWADLLVARPGDNVNAEAMQGIEACKGCPPIVAPMTRPRGLGNNLDRFGFTMSGN